MWRRDDVRGSTSLQPRLVQLVLAALTPLVVFAAVLVLLLNREHRAVVDRGMRDTVHALESALERELVAAISTLRAMAASPTLRTEDLRAFYVDAEGVLPTQRGWLTIHLASPDGQELWNLAQPFGESLGRVTELDSFERVKQTLRPAVGDIARGAVSGYVAFAVRVPVIEHGRLRYVLSAVISPEAVSNLLAELEFSRDWLGYVLDRGLRIVARTRFPSAAGMLPSDEVRARIADGQQHFVAATRDGVAMYAAVTTSGLSGWTIGLAAPAAQVLAPLRLSLLLLVVSGAAAVGVGIALAVLAARRIARPIAELADAAAAVGRGEIAGVPPRGFPEIDEVSAALRTASVARRDTEAALRTARETVEAATRAKDHMIARVSHELRTPLQSIVAWLRLVETGNLAPPVRARAFRTIHDNVEIQARLIDDLLEVSRVVTGTLRLDVRPVRAADFVERAVEAVRPTAMAKEIRLDVSIRAATAHVLGDPARLRQVCWNLLSNAVKFTPRRGAIAVTVDETDSVTRIAISDTGEGIPPESLAQVFEPFWQGSRPPIRSQGLGLGLALAREIVELHGGTISAHSGGEGHGTTVTVELPCHEEPPADRSADGEAQGRRHDDSSP